MKRYLIKATYLEGKHAGRSYLLRKGGYVTDEGAYQWEDTTYATLGIAQRVCKQYAERNEQDRDLERGQEVFDLKTGRRKEPKAWYIHELESYEPYEVEV